MTQEETQLDIINRLLPLGKLTSTEKNIYDQLELLETEEEKIVYAASPLSETIRKNLLEDSHEYITSLLKKINEKDNFIFETFADWYDLKAVSYEIVAQYLQGKVAYQILVYNFVETQKMSEEQLKSLITKKKNLFRRLKRSTMVLDTNLPLEKKLDLYQELDIIRKMNTLQLVKDYNSNLTLEEISTFGNATFFVSWYYKHQDNKIEPYIQEVIKSEIKYRKENTPVTKPYVFAKTK